MKLCEHQINPKHCKRCEIARNKQSEESKKMNPQQIENWKEVLATQIGSGAYLLPDHIIQEYRDDCQRRLNVMGVVTGAGLFE